MHKQIGPLFVSLEPQGWLNFVLPGWGAHLGRKWQILYFILSCNLCIITLTQGVFRKLSSRWQNQIQISPVTNYKIKYTNMLICWLKISGGNLMNSFVKGQGTLVNNLVHRRTSWRKKKLHKTSYLTSFGVVIICSLL